MRMQLVFGGVCMQLVFGGVCMQLVFGGVCIQVVCAYDGMHLYRFMHTMLPNLRCRAFKLTCCPF